MGEIERRELQPADLVAVAEAAEAVSRVLRNLTRVRRGEEPVVVVESTRLDRG